MQPHLLYCGPTNCPSSRGLAWMRTHEARIPKLICLTRWFSQAEVTAVTGKAASMKPLSRVLASHRASSSALAQAHSLRSIHCSKPGPEGPCGAIRYQESRRHPQRLRVGLEGRRYLRHLAQSMKPAIATRLITSVGINLRQLQSSGVSDGCFASHSGRLRRKQKGGVDINDTTLLKIVHI